MMAAALRLGRRNLGQTHPNPAVGCIIVKTEGDDRVVVGRGWTAAGGRPHAEREALTEAGAAAKGATAYVTLEPCAHQGPGQAVQRGADRGGRRARRRRPWRIPTRARLGRGMPSSRTPASRLRQACLPRKQRLAHSGHINRVTKGRPHVTLKLAVSADGMIGRRAGERMIVTGKRRIRHSADDAD